MTSNTKNLDEPTLVLQRFQVNFRNGDTNENKFEILGEKNQTKINDKNKLVVEGSIPISNTISID